MKFSKIELNKFDLLVSIYIFCLITAELMGSKTFPLANVFGYQFNASVAILLLPIIFTINDIIIEVKGHARARSVVYSGFFAVFLMFVYTFIATGLQPSARSQGNETAYDLIFGSSARIAAASLTAFFVAQLLDLAVFVRLRERLGKSRLWLRNNLSNFISQFFDTVIFISLAFYAFDQSFSANWGFLWSIILPYWFLKCVMSVIETPLAYAGVRWLRAGDKTA